MKRKKRNYTRTIDLLFLLVLLISLIYAFYSLFQMNLLPTPWLLAALAVSIVIYLLLFGSALRRWTRWFVYAKRVFIALLCVLLVIVGHYSGRVNRLLNDISTAQDETVEVYVLARADSTLSSVEELADSAGIGVQSGSDAEVGSYMKEQLSQAAPGALISKDTYYANLIANLSLGNLDAVAISANYYDMMIENEEISEDSFRKLATSSYTKT